MAFRQDGERDAFRQLAANVQSGGSGNRAGQVPFLEARAFQNLAIPLAWAKKGNVFDRT